MDAATQEATPVHVVDSGSVGGDQNRDKKKTLNVVFVKLEANVATCLFAKIFKAILFCSYMYCCVLYSFCPKVKSFN